MEIDVGMIIVSVICMWISGILIGFSVRGMIERNLNKKIKGYRSFWNRKCLISEESE